MGYFANCLNRTATTFIANASLLGKVYFHRLVIPVSVVISNLIAFSIQLTIFHALLAAHSFTGGDLPVTTWALLTPVLLLLLAGYGLGSGVIVCALTTRYRDLAQLVGFGVQLFMCATPIIYPLSAVPERYQWVLHLNPLTPAVEGFRLGFIGAGTVTLGSSRRASASCSPSWQSG